MTVGEGSSARAEVVTVGITPVVRLSGELDLSSVESVRPVVDSVLKDKPALVIFDMSGLTFMDSSGIALLLGAARAVKRLELHNPSPIIRQVIEMTGLGTILVITE